jgi:hypothetical protein
MASAPLNGLITTATPAVAEFLHAASTPPESCSSGRDAVAVDTGSGRARAEGLADGGSRGSSIESDGRPGPGYELTRERLRFLHAVLERRHGQLAAALPPEVGGALSAALEELGAVEPADEESGEPAGASIRQMEHNSSAPASQGTRARRVLSFDSLRGRQRDASERPHKSSPQSEHIYEPMPNSFKQGGGGDAGRAARPTTGSALPGGSPADSSDADPAPPSPGKGQVVDVMRRGSLVPLGSSARAARRVLSFETLRTRRRKQGATPPSQPAHDVADYSPLASGNSFLTAAAQSPLPRAAQPGCCFRGSSSSTGEMAALESVPKTRPRRTSFERLTSRKAVG